MSIKIMDWGRPGENRTETPALLCATGFIPASKTCEAEICVSFVAVENGAPRRLSILLGVNDAAYLTERLGSQLGIAERSNRYRSPVGAKGGS